MLQLVTAMAIRSFVAASALLLSLCSHRASANCARPIVYGVVADGSTVAVDSVNFDARGCPDPGGMLRQNVTTSEIVRIADFCRPPMSGQESAVYVDECVPPGTYRYGFAVPFECAPSACSTSFFATVTVAAPLAADCARSAGNPGPRPAAAVPWRDDEYICEYGSLGGTLMDKPWLVLVGFAAILAGALGFMFVRRRRRASP